MSKAGVDVVFGSQAAIVAFFVILLITPVIFFSRPKVEVTEIEANHSEKAV